MIKFSILSSFFLFFTSVGSASNVKRKLKSDDGGSNDVNPDECARTVPQLIFDALDLGEEWGFLLGQQDGDWSSVCCTASALRAETGTLWTEPPVCLPYINTGIPYFGIPIEDRVRRASETGGRRLLADTPMLEADPYVVTNFLEPLHKMEFQRRRRTNEESGADAANEATGDADARNDRSRRLARNMDGPHGEAIRQNFKQAEEAARSIFKPDVDIRATIIKFLGLLSKSQTNPSVSEQETEEGSHRRLGDISLLLTESCPALFPDTSFSGQDLVDDIDLRFYYGLIVDFDGPVRDFLESDLAFFICNFFKDDLALLALELFSPWLLPACHCKYRKDGCGISSCYDTCVEDCEEGPVYTPKANLISDISVATTSYWRSFLYQDLSEEGLFLPTDLGTLRACQACPGEATYFEGRLFEFNEVVDVVEDFVEGGSGISFSEDTFNGLLPVRRGGKPFDQCLGMCFMYGLVENPFGDCLLPAI